MARSHAVLVAVAIIVFSLPGCMEQSVEVNGVCLYVWAAGPVPKPGGGGGGTEPCKEQPIQAKRTSDGKVYKTTTDAEGRFRFQLSP